MCIDKVKSIDQSVKAIMRNGQRPPMAAMIIQCNGWWEEEKQTSKFIHPYVKKIIYRVCFKDSNTIIYIIKYKNATETTKVQKTEAYLSGKLNLNAL